MEYKNLLIEVNDHVALITLHRPKALNALNDAMMSELEDALIQFDQDDNVHVVVITGSEKVFAAGADIKVMAEYNYVDVYKENFITHNWEKLREFRKPVIAAVSGYALGGGSELAMLCDIIIAADNAQFGQPEIELGLIPGFGGTQRLPRAIGKAKAMDLCLTARRITAQEADALGLVSRVVPTDELLPQTLTIAKQIASYSLPVVMMIKQSINMAYEGTLHSGIQFERALFHSVFALSDQKEGTRAFLEKRKPLFNHQ